WATGLARNTASKPRWTAQTTVEVTERRALRVDTTVERRDHGGGYWAPGTSRRNHYGVPRPRCTHSGLGTPPLPRRSLLSASRQRRGWPPPQGAIGSGPQGEERCRDSQGPGDRCKQARVSQPSARDTSGVAEQFADCCGSCRYGIPRRNRAQPVGHELRRGEDI